MAFFLGALTIILILLPFWVLSAEFPSVSDAWLNIVAKQAITYDANRGRFSP